MLEAGGVVDVVAGLNARESVHEGRHGSGARRVWMRDREGRRERRKWSEAEHDCSREEVGQRTVRPVYRIGRDDGICVIFCEPSDRYDGWSASLVRRERKE